MKTVTQNKMIVLRDTSIKLESSRFSVSRRNKSETEMEESFESERERQKLKAACARLSFQVRFR